MIKTVCMIVVMARYDHTKPFDQIAFDANSIKTIENVTQFRNCPGAKSFIYGNVGCIKDETPEELAKRINKECRGSK